MQQRIFRFRERRILRVGYSLFQFKIIFGSQITLLLVTP